MFMEGIDIANAVRENAIAVMLPEQQARVRIADLAIEQFGERVIEGKVYAGIASTKIHDLHTNIVETLEAFSKNNNVSLNALDEGQRQKLAKAFGEALYGTVVTPMNATFASRVSGRGAHLHTELGAYEGAVPAIHARLEAELPGIRAEIEAQPFALRAITEAQSGRFAITVPGGDAGKQALAGKVAGLWEKLPNYQYYKDLNTSDKNRIPALAETLQICGEKQGWQVNPEKFDLEYAEAILVGRLSALKPTMEESLGYSAAQREREYTHRAPSIVQAINSAAEAGPSQGEQRNWQQSLARAEGKGGLGSPS